ncbi:MAG: hypothetical protein FWH57_02865 [Oscillospiraceae bacterium]|nr:hypothetical protein [Oscillospiraceae bacterium]
MLGGFAILSGESCITEQVGKASKVWKLIQYLIANRYKSVSQDELINVFCDGELVANPGSALRTMVSRARAALVKAGLPRAEELILAKSGGYAWNNARKCVVDAEQFEYLCKKAGTGVGDDERLELLLQAADLYKGDFLPNSAGDMWVIPLARWYRSMYINCAHDALELLTRTGRSVEAEELCAKALRTDPFDEQLLEYRLRSLLAQGKNTEAVDEYKRMETMFYDVLCVQFSENLCALYNQIQKPVIREGASLEAVIDDFLKDADYAGAYYCDITAFKTICQIEARSMSRSGRTTFIARFDAKHEPRAKNGGVMKQLAIAIPRSLRKGDMFTRATPNQYMLMLNNLTYEDCKSLIDRIMYSLETKYLPKIIGVSIKPLKPIF